MEKRRVVRFVLYIPNSPDEGRFSEGSKEPRRRLFISTNSRLVLHPQTNVHPFSVVEERRNSVEYPVSLERRAGGKKRRRGRRKRRRDGWVSRQTTRTREPRSFGERTGDETLGNSKETRHRGRRVGRGRTVEARGAERGKG